MIDNNKQLQLNFWQVLRGVFAAFLGVQSNEQSQLDFKSGNLKLYIAFGIMLTLLFVLTLVSVVKMVLP